ncbi:MAG: GAF domain-containing protein [Cereibacter sphaeroides]|uniref:GAF domain-containing protein n=1 Tax=Cereibacter sphaeroides TaxID=1063 RepID=A0A2W5SJT3_CERSP|nr:MAG: GAF domain-containing protein [Cereibacter sphaeroides]
MTDADAIFRDLHNAVAALAGARLFTVTRIDLEHGLARRIYTSDAKAYPTSGTKPIHQDGWTAQVIEGQQSFVANTTAEFAVYFPDHALINQLGCYSALNVPVVDKGQTIATVNVLDDQDRFSPATVAAIEGAIHASRGRLVPAVLASPLG